jgi:hypothetical protein
MYLCPKSETHTHHQEEHAVSDTDTHTQGTAALRLVQERLGATVVNGEAQ